MADIFSNNTGKPLANCKVNIYVKQLASGFKVYLKPKPSTC